MEKFSFLVMSLFLSTAGITAAADDAVTVLKTPAEYRKSVEAAHHARKGHVGVTRVSDATVALPWVENFDDESSFDAFTIIDANDDFCTWEYSDGVAQYCCIFADGPADDWLITPGFEMIGGKKYQISFRANSFDESSPEEFSAWLGTAPEAEAMTIEVVETTVVAQDNAIDFDVTVEIPEDGVYYLGFHCTTSSEDALNFDLDDICVKEGAVAAAPGAVTGFTVVPDPEGELRATVSFTTPVVATDGSALSSLVKVDIYRDDTNLIKTFDNPEPGTLLTYVDETPVNGDNRYTVIPYNEAGEGKASYFSLFVGEDVPNAPQNIVQKVDGTDIVISWEPDPVGWNNHYVNVAKMNYDIWETADGINLVEVAKGVSGTSYRVEGRAEQGEQMQNTYVVRGNTGAGNGTRGYSNTIIVGQSKGLPYQESFAGKKLSSKWFKKSDDRNDEAALVDTDFDGDGGAIALAGHKPGCTIDFFSSKVWIKNEAKLQLSFWYISPADATLSVGLSKDFEDVKVITLEPTEEWKQMLVDLSEFTDNEYAQIIFRYQAGVEPCIIDNILLTATPLGINVIDSADEAGVVQCYGVDGRRVSDNSRGIVIERRSDGTYTKRVVR